MARWKEAWDAMTHWGPYTPAPLPEFEVRLVSNGSARLEHAQVRRMQGARGLDGAVAFAGKWPPYHAAWMQGAQDYPSCTGNASNANHELTFATGAPSRPIWDRGHGRRLRMQVQKGCLSAH